MARGGSRNLRVDISGDPKGFDQAAKQAQAAAGAFDKELEKLERQEKKVERQTERNAAAMRRLEKAQKEAADAAGRLERGEIDAAEAARLQERAENQLNKVLMAQAAVTRAAAKAANELAEEQRQAARAAELAAGKQRLAQLKAAGSAKEHNTVLRQLKARFPELAKDSSSAFKEMQTVSTRAFSALSSTGPVAIGAVVLAIAALPTLATLAGGAITLGLGGALVGLGVMAAAQSARVKSAFADLGKDLGESLKTISKPFEGTLLHVADVARRTFDGFAPTLASSFAGLAPVVSRFAEQFGGALLQLRPVIDSISRSFGAVLGSLGPRMGTVFRNLGAAITPITDAVADNADEFTSLVVALSVAVRYVGDLAGALIRLYPAVAPIAPLLKAITGSSGGMAPALGAAAFSAGALALTTAGLAGQTGRMATTMEMASQTADGLKTSLDGLAGKTLTAREAARAYQQAVDDAIASIKENGRTLNINTQAGRNNQAALDSLAKTAHAQAVAFRASDMSAAQVARGMNAARSKFISTSVAMGDTRRHAVDVASKLFGVRDAANAIPRGKSTKVTAPGIGNAIRASKDMRAAVRNIPQSWPVTITYYVKNQGAAIRASKQMYAKGGYIDGYAGGGEIQGYPAGGMIQGVGGPTADANLIAASRGEFMVNAASTSEFRPLLEAINAGRVTPKSAAYGSAMSHRSAAPGGGSSHVVVEFRSDGSPIGDMMISALRPAVAKKGGNVQVVIGN